MHLGRSVLFDNFLVPLEARKFSYYQRCFTAPALSITTKNFFNPKVRCKTFNTILCEWPPLRRLFSYAGIYKTHA